MGSDQGQWLNQVGSVLERLNQGVIINDEHKRVVFANSMFLEMIKMRTEDLLGRAITELYPTEDIPLLLEFIGRRESQGRAQYEFYIRQANGGRLPVAVTARQVRTADGHLFGIVTDGAAQVQFLALSAPAANAVLHGNRSSDRRMSWNSE
jgi:PAS domain S-box-containing protein